MRRLVAAIVLAAGLFMLAGPAFGVASVLAGSSIHVRGGAARAAVDVTVGLLLLASAHRLRSATSRIR